MEKEYKIDYDLFNVHEIMKIVKFFNMIEGYKYKKPSKEEMVNSYREYQTILNNKTLEKQYDKMLFDKSRVSIYKTMMRIMGK
ncbi:MAG: UPF0223 family protein [Bacilli bacterium]